MRAEGADTGESGAEDTEEEALACDSEWVLNNCRVRGGGRDCRLDIVDIVRERKV